MKSTKKLWTILGVVCFVSFLLLGNLGKDIYQMAPPIPDVTVEGGEVLYKADEIKRGQQVWQSMGGHDIGSVWGHGSCMAPDWSADWLHREAVALLEIYSKRRFNVNFDSLDHEYQAALKATLKKEMRTNTYDSEKNSITISKDRAEAVKQVEGYYMALFGDDPKKEGMREKYAIKNNPVPDNTRRHELAAFFFWSAWATSTNRPGRDYTYTSNWPHEKLIDNKPLPSMLLWSMFSVLAMMAGVGILAWHYTVESSKEENAITPPESDPLAGLSLTPSMKASFKFFAVVSALFVAQILLGIVTAHYTVEGHALYGIPLADILPYTVTRTWHLQLAVFWIATSWLATGIFIGPLISGKEPKFQVWGVNFLFLCLLVIVVGSMFGEWAGVQQMFDNLTMNFWFGNQGWEFIELGRFWQLFLFIGLVLWVILVSRAILPAVKEKSESRSLYAMLLISGLTIGLFYGAGLMWGQDTHMSVVEYWRWWVVHLWVEGIFEVFATVAVAFLFVKLGLIHVRTATTAVIFATIIFMFAGILGTAHHWYFTGTPVSTIAFGAMFSALEVVPLVLMGVEAYHNYQLAKSREWMKLYHWPVMFLIAVAFWNFVGAGLFGFLINPPMSLYYVQGMNTTPTHGHGALFGVYGMLALGLMLFCLRGMANPKAWSDRMLKWAFWSLNIGLGMMLVMSLLPVGILQTIASIKYGAWYARSAEFLHQPIIHSLIWARVPGDIIFGIGGFLIAIFVARLWLLRNKS